MHTTKQDESPKNKQEAKSKWWTALTVIISLGALVWGMSVWQGGPWAISDEKPVAKALKSSQKTNTQDPASAKLSGTSFEAGAVHKALTQESDWLNVSRPLTAEDLKGRIILVDFWTYCCINCMHVFPDLKALEEEFGEDLTVIGVHSAKFENEKDQENIRAAVLRHDIKHPVVNDDDFKIWGLFEVRAWPTLVLISPDGQVVEYLSGEGHRETLRERIAQLKDLYDHKFNRSHLPLALESQKDQAFAASELKFPGKLAYAPDRGWLFISDAGNHRILVTDVDGKVLHQIGQRAKPGAQDGGFFEARFRGPQGLLYQEGKLYVADTENHLLREIDLDKQQVKTVAGTGKQGRPLGEKNLPALETALSSPWDLASYAKAGGKPDDIAVAMAGTHQLWTFNPGSGEVSVLAGNARESIDDGVFPYNSLSQPSGLAAYQDKLYLVDAETSSLRVLQNGQLTTLIGTGLFDFGFQDGKQGKAKMQHPLGVWADAGGVYIADAYNHAIRLYHPETKRLSTLVGEGKRSDQLNEPNDIIKIGEDFFVADTNNQAIRLFDTKGQAEKALALKFPGDKTKVAQEKNIQKSATQTKATQANNTTEPKTVELKRRLPNLKVTNAEKAPAGEALQLSLQYPEGYELNEEAPSWLELVEVSGERGQVLKHLSKDTLKQTNFSLAGLQPGKDYRLQGTLYYCRADKTGACLVESRDQSLSLTASASPSLSLKVGQ